MTHFFRLTIAVCLHASLADHSEVFFSRAFHSLPFALNLWFLFIVILYSVHTAKNINRSVFLSTLFFVRFSMYSGIIIRVDICMEFLYNLLKYLLLTCLLIFFLSLSCFVLWFTWFICTEFLLYLFHWFHWNGNFSEGHWYAN